MSLISSVALAAMASASLANPSQNAASSVDPFFKACMRGQPPSDSGSLEEIKFSELPNSFQRNFSRTGEATFLRYSTDPQRFLLIYQSGYSTGLDQCAFAIEGVSLNDGRERVRKRLKWTGSASFPAKTKHIADPDPSGRYVIHYYYLQDENFMHNMKSGPRFLVLHILFNSAQVPS